MLAKTHKRIAKEIAEKLQLGRRESSLLRQGSIAPDKWGNFPHHRAKDGEIAAYILEARELFEREDDECYHKLGIALHYVADKWTLRPRTRDEHTKYEVEIEASSLLDDSQLKNRIVESLFPTKIEKEFLAFLDNISKGISGISINEAQKVRLTYEERNWILNKGDITQRTYMSSSLDRDTNLELIISNFGKRVIFHSTQDHPSGWGSPTLDLNFVYRIGLEMVRSVLSPNGKTGKWHVSYNLKEMKQALDNILQHHYNIAAIRKHHILSSNNEYSDNTEFYVIGGYVEVTFNKGLWRGYEYGTIDFRVKINPENKIVSVEHSRSK